MFFANPLLLFGLFAVAIPPLVHFFSRRRYVEVDWGAMQFLRLSPRSRRRVLLDQWLLLSLRMAALALLAFALAGPSIRSTRLNRSADQSPRTTIVLIDASASMAVKSGGRTATDAAREWVTQFVNQMRPGDRVALFAVKGNVIPLLATPSTDREQALAALELLLSARGTADWPTALESAQRTLDTVDGEKEVLILSDGQRFGWSDESTQARWELLARNPLPRSWVVNVVPNRTANDARTAITSFTVNHDVSTIGSEQRFTGQVAGAATIRLRLTIDGRNVGEVPVSAESFAFTRKLPAGSHLVSVSLDDLRRDVAVDVVPPQPVLIVGGSNADVFLRQVLAPANDPEPAFLTRSISIAQFTPATLTENVKGVGTRPRVVILANVTALSAEQDAAIEKFAAEGGGVLVALGDRTDATAWNRVSHRGGRGWLPALIQDQANNPGDATAAPKPLTANVDHPALKLFRENQPGGLQTAYFPRYWRLKPDSGAILSLTNDAPLLVEKSMGRGRVVVAAVPLADTWETNLIRLPDFLPLVHELGHYLAAGALTDANLPQGEPIVFRPTDNEPPAAITVLPPDGLPRVVPVKAWPATLDFTRDPGPYRVTTAAGQVRYFVVRPDEREADLTPSSESERNRVAAILGSVEDVSTLDELATRRGRGPVAVSFGEWLLPLVLALFAVELWYTQRVTMGR